MTFSSEWVLSRNGTYHNKSTSETGYGVLLIFKTGQQTPKMLRTTPTVIEFEDHFFARSIVPRPDCYVYHEVEVVKVGEVVYEL